LTLLVATIVSIGEALNWGVIRGLIGGKWYWFNGAGYMVEKDWYQDQGKWYYLGADGAMVIGLHVIDSKVYYFNGSGAMATKPVTLIPDENGVLH